MQFFIQIKNGKNEIAEYLEKLQKKKDKNSRINFNKITAYIDLLSKYGLSLGEPFIKHIENDIWELRPLRNRILFVYWENNTFILLSYFIKQTQKTPFKEIEKARNLLADYLYRSDQNGK